ncbi:hypothetical protein AAMO2058_000595500 [Amorphochlora amoebiformis]
MICRGHTPISFIQEPETRMEEEYKGGYLTEEAYRTRDIAGKQEAINKREGIKVEFPTDWHETKERETASAGARSVTIRLNFPLNTKKIANNKEWYDTNRVGSTIIRRLGPYFPKALYSMRKVYTARRAEQAKATGNHTAGLNSNFSISLTQALSFYHLLNPTLNLDPQSIQQYFYFRSCYRAIMTRYFGLTRNFTMLNSPILQPTPEEGHLHCTYLAKANLADRFITIIVIPKGYRNLNSEDSRVAFDLKTPSAPMQSQQSRSWQQISVPRAISQAMPSTRSSEAATMQEEAQRAWNGGENQGCPGITISMLIKVGEIPKITEQSRLVQWTARRTAAISYNLTKMLDLEEIERKLGSGTHKPSISFPTVMTDALAYLASVRHPSERGELNDYWTLGFKFKEEDFYLDTEKREQDFDRCRAMIDYCGAILNKTGIDWTKPKANDGCIICSFKIAPRDVPKVLTLRLQILQDFQALVDQDKIKCLPTISITRAQNVIRTREIIKKQEAATSRTVDVLIEATCAAGVCIINKLLGKDDWKGPSFRILRIQAFPTVEGTNSLTNKDVQLLGDCLPALKVFLKTFHQILPNMSGQLVASILAQIVEYWAFDATPRNNDSPRIKKADVNSERPTTPISKPPITSISIPPITSISKPPRLDLDDRCKEDENHSEIEKRFSEVEWYKRRPRAPPSTPKRNGGSDNCDEYGRNDEKNDNVTDLAANGVKARRDNSPTRGGVQPGRDRSPTRSTGPSYGSQPSTVASSRCTGPSYGSQSCSRLPSVCTGIFEGFQTISTQGTFSSSDALDGSEYVLATPHHRRNDTNNLLLTSFISGQRVSLGSPTPEAYQNFLAVPPSRNSSQEFPPGPDKSSRFSIRTMGSERPRNLQIPSKVEQRPSNKPETSLNRGSRA